MGRGAPQQETRSKPAGGPDGLGCPAAAPPLGGRVSMCPQIEMSMGHGTTTIYLRRPLRSSWRRERLILASMGVERLQKLGQWLVSSHATFDCERWRSEIRLVRRRDVRVLFGVVFMWVFGADRFGPFAQRAQRASPPPRKRTPWGWTTSRWGCLKVVDTFRPSVGQPTETCFSSRCRPQRRPSSPNALACRR
jgi:hypothetical protein